MSAELHISPHPEISGVTCISTAAHSFPRPFTGVVGGIHGNEACGTEALELLRQDALAGRLPLCGGTLFLIHGNPEATRRGLRHTSEGTDLNRLFAFEFVNRMPERKWCSEHRRALELRPLLAELDVALDLHSATAPTPPFGIVSRVAESGPLGRKLGLPYLTHGWEGPGQLGNRTLLHMLSHRHKPSLAVECGQHDDPWATERAHSTALHFLVALDQLPDEAAPALPEEPPLELNIVDAVKKPSAGFQFHFRFIGLQQIPPDAVVGSDENLEVRCKRGAFLIMPNASVEVGQDMLYLAHQIDPSTHVPEDEIQVPENEPI